MALVRNPDKIRLGIAGMVEENGHPYSWAAILNGFNSDVMNTTGYPMIYNYLSAEHPSRFGIDGVAVTHAWCDRCEDAERLAAASRIQKVVNRPEDMIDYVDAVLIPTDKGQEHVDRAKPFVDAGLPVFIDKPLTDSIDGLKQFRQWHDQGKAFMSTAMMRYCREFAQCQSRLYEIGELRLIILTVAKSWERYGIHAIEGAYRFLSPGGWQSVCNTGSGTSNLVHIRHDSGVEVLIPVIDDMFGGFGCLSLIGTRDRLDAQFTDGSRFESFKSQLQDFISYLRTGQRPVPFEHMAEIVKMVIAGIHSRDENGRRVELSEIRI